MTLRNTPVPLPPKKIILKTANNGTTYVYYTLRTYRNKHGNPTSDVAAIGKLDPTTGMLIPNLKYFELFPEAVQPKPPVLEPECQKPNSDASTSHPLPIRAASYGIPYVLHRIASDIGLIGVLSKCLPEHHAQVLGLASYILEEGNAMMYLEDWFDETEVFFTRRLNARTCSRVYSALTHGTQSHFFTEWLSYCRECEYLAYDVKSISAYSNGKHCAESEYDQDGDYLPQVNLAMFVGAESGLPVCYSLYSGSISDKSRIDLTLDALSKLGLTDCRFVFDRRFISAGNIRFLSEKHCQFVAAMPHELMEAERLIDAVTSSVRCSAPPLDGHHVHVTSCDSVVFGFKMKAHVYFDSEKQAMDREALQARVDGLRDELEEIARKRRVTNQCTDLSEAKQDAGITFSLCNGRIDDKLSRAGHLILLSNDDRLSNSEILSIYRRRSMIEKCFDQLEHDIDSRHLRPHGSETTDPKMFLAFIALILHSHLQKKISGGSATKHLTVEQVLRELRRIQLVVFQDRSRKVLPLTKLQESILRAIGIRPSELISSVA